MAKTLRTFLEVAEPKSDDEKNFKDKHVTVKHADRNGNDDSLFKGKTKKSKTRDADYEDGEDEQVYEEKKSIQFDSYADMIEELYDLADAEEKLALDEILSTPEGLMELVHIMEEEEPESLEESKEFKVGQQATVNNKYDDYYAQTGKVVAVPKKAGEPYKVKFKDGTTNEYGGVELK